MKIKEAFDEINKPCKKCPYKLGYIKTLRNPCPECKLNGYKSYKYFFDLFSQQRQESSDETL